MLSPDLFNIYCEMTLCSIYGYDVVKVSDQNINNLRYADDAVLVADSEKQLERTVNIVVEES